MFIIDGHVHTYPDHAAPRVIDSFTAFHRMEPTASLGKGTVGDLLEKMQAGGVHYAVTANFAPRKKRLFTESCGNRAKQQVTRENGRE
jgi:hypothetical protein